MDRTPDSSRIKAFQRKILDFYRREGRDLPWRHTTDPYPILVAEVMLQQTQVERVIPHYRTWLDALPTLADLARIDRKSLLRLWSGLGYNNRALRLRELAREVCEKHLGRVPREREVLLALPGIGPYTAGALLAFAFNREAPVVDTNIRRVLIQEFDLPRDCSRRELEELSRRCIPPGRAREWFNALMDYGATVATARRTGIKPEGSQGRFEGSPRQVRGFITRYLTTHEILEEELLQERFQAEPVAKALAGLAREGMITREKGRIRLRP